MNQWSFDEGYGKFVSEVAKELGVEADNEVVLARVYALVNLAKDVAGGYDSKPDYWSSCSQCEGFKSHAEDVLSGDYWRNS